MVSVVTKYKDDDGVVYAAVSFEKKSIIVRSMEDGERVALLLGVSHDRVQAGP